VSKHCVSKFIKYENVINEPYVQESGKCSNLLPQTKTLKPVYRPKEANRNKYIHSRFNILKTVKISPVGQNVRLTSIRLSQMCDVGYVKPDLI
jgi:hypothetical protein